MSSFWRSFFTNPHSTTGPVPAPTLERKSKSHGRSSSTPVVHTSVPARTPASYIYAPPTSKSASSYTHPTRKRSSSHVASRPPPSPLRFATYNSTRTYSQTNSDSSRPPVQRSSSQGRTSTDYPIPYAIYTPSVSFSSSSRSCSNSSIRMPPRTSSSNSVPRHSFEMRPALKQNHTWHGDDGERGRAKRPSTAPQAGSMPTSVEIHPLLSTVRSRKAVIGYDAAYLPSSRSVLDRHTRSPIPESTLLQPATRQSITSSLILRSHKFPWIVTVSPTSTKSKPTFYLAGSNSSHSRPSANPITILDVLSALHVSLNTPITQQEWDGLGEGSKAQRKITKAYQSRCTRMSGGWEGGVRRIDWLGSKTRLVGLEVDASVPDGRTCKLNFSKA